MKIFFVLAVLIAAAYLAIPSKTSEQLKQYLPQVKIEQAATNLLSKVDEKLNAVKQQLLTQQDKRIAVLEDKLIQLEEQLQQQLANQSGINNAEFILPAQQMTLAVLEDKLMQLEERLQQQLANQSAINSEFNKNTSLSESKRNNAEFVLPEQQMAAQQQLTNQLFEDERANNHKKRINRQAQLQEIAERMTQSSLLAVINN